MLVPVRIGQETLLEDNFPDDEIGIELAPIAVQLAYVQQVRLLHFFKCLDLLFSDGGSE